MFLLFALKQCLLDYNVFFFSSLKENYHEPDRVTKYSFDSGHIFMTNCFKKLN